MNYQQTAVNGTEGIYYASPFLWVVKLTKLKPVIFQPRLVLLSPLFMHLQMSTSHTPCTFVSLWIACVHAQHDHLAGRMYVSSFERI